MHNFPPPWSASCYFTPLFLASRPPRVWLLCFLQPTWRSTSWFTFQRTGNQVVSLGGHFRSSSQIPHRTVFTCFSLLMVSRAKFPFFRFHWESNNRYSCFKFIQTPLFSRGHSSLPPFYLQDTAEGNQSSGHLSRGPFPVQSAFPINPESSQSQLGRWEPLAQSHYIFFGIICPRFFLDPAVGYTFETEKNVSSCPPYDSYSVPKRLKCTEA